MKEQLRIPTTFCVGGQDIVVKRVERCEGYNIGECHISQGEVEVAKNQSESSAANTFYHELVHSILYTMGEYDLNNNEKFVSSFAGFLTEALRSAEYGEEVER